MIFRHILDALRFIRKHPAFTAINVIGLMLGITSCLLIMLYINSELTFDKFHTNGKNIYRVVMLQPGNRVVGSSSDWWVVSPAILKPTWENELPEVGLITKTQDKQWAFQCGDQLVKEHVLLVDPEIFGIFTFPLKNGVRARALNDPYTIVISQRMAEKYFGEEDPMGKSMTLNTGTQMTVTGILEEIPGNSHLQFDALVSFKTVEAMSGKSLLSENWLQNSYRTYLTLDENTDVALFDAKLRKYDIEGFNGNAWSFHLQPLYDIHFNNQLAQGTGNRGTVFILATVGIFILFIACFNFLNLCIAHYRAHIRDISIRKFIGASRSGLVFQFLSKSLLIVFISYLISVLAIRIALPVLNTYIEQDLEYTSLWSPRVLLASLVIVATIAFVSGIYPAVLFSRMHLYNALKGGMVKLSRTSQYFRKGVVLLQFAISIALIAGSITMIRQLKYAGTRDPGYKTENILCLKLFELYTDGFGSQVRVKPFMQELLRNPDILAVSASSGLPCNIGWSNIPVWEGISDDEQPFFYRMVVDYDFMELYGFGLAEGRNFSRDIASDDGNAYIINEAAVKRTDLRFPLGAKFGFDGIPGTVVGVAKDFNFESLHKPVTPLGIGVQKDYFWTYISVKINGLNIRNNLDYIEQQWKKYFPDYPVNYTFIDELLEQMYGRDRQLSKAMNYLSLMALIISCLGIFGLISLSLRERTKEIGIRKVLGVSYPDLFSVLSREILSIIFMASFAGGVMGWYFSSEWLKNFSYRIRLGPDVIIASAAFTFLMTMATVSFRLYRSMRSNPVDSLRFE